MNLFKSSLAIAVFALAANASAGSYTSPGGAIPDNLPASPLVVSFNVTEAGPLAAVNLTLTNLAHTWAGDLIVTLTSPNGTVADIMRRPQSAVGVATSIVGDSTNFNGTYRFIDTGGSLAVALNGTDTATVPSGDYQASTRNVGVTLNTPVLLNSVFANTPIFGTWTLRLSDNAALDTGTLGSATLNVTAVPEPGTYALMGLGLAGLMVAARRRKQA